MSGGEYLGVILAAGHGSRMGPFGERWPKPIAPICNKPLLAYQLEQMRGLGVEDVIILIGHLGYRIIETLGDGAAHGVRIRYVEQEERLGLAHAVGQLERHVDRPFLLMLGDIFFEVSDLAAMARIFTERGCAGVLAVKEEQDAGAVRKNFVVTLDDTGAVRRVIEKPRHVEGMLKGCGIYLFDLHIFDAIRRTPRTALRDEYELTDAVQILIGDGHSVGAAHVVDWDMNLTFVGDLIDCCVRRLRRDGRDALTGEGCTLAEGVALADTVLGDGVRIAQPVRLERCVFLPGAVYEGAADLTGTVVTEDGVLHPA